MLMILSCSRDQSILILQIEPRCIRHRRYAVRCAAGLIPGQFADAQEGSVRHDARVRGEALDLE
ncbi:hypothetical protein B0G69_7247 [Paraburkholderia sp. RAU2J]|nr:hypothetical protein B0G69_7247 [Paraburkholderia sp. RAU2J]